MKVLLIRTDRIGDLLLSTPVARALKELSGDNHVAMMVSSYTSPILEKNPHVDEIVIYDTRQSDRELRTKMRKGYDVAVLLHPTFRLAWSLVRAGVPKRIGTASRVYSFLFNEKVRLRRSLSGLHEAVCNLHMVETLCGADMNPLPEIFIDDMERDEASRSLTRLGLNSGTFVAIHPGSGGSARVWPVQKFADLADAVHSRTGKKVLVTGGAGEEELVSQMVSLMKTSPAVVAGTAGIRQLAAVLEKAELIVTNSTGPMHLATAVGTPVVAVFCPMVGCSPARWGPLGSRSEVLMPDVPLCRKCTGKRCVYYDCMDRVSVDSVLGSVEKVLIQ